MIKLLGKYEGGPILDSFELSRTPITADFRIKAIKEPTGYHSDDFSSGHYIHLTKEGVYLKIRNYRVNYGLFRPTIRGLKSVIKPAVCMFCAWEDMFWYDQKSRRSIIMAHTYRKITPRKSAEYILKLLRKSILLADSLRSMTLKEMGKHLITSDKLKFLDYGPFFEYMGVIYILRQRGDSDKYYMYEAMDASEYEKLYSLNAVLKEYVPENSNLKKDIESGINPYSSSNQ